MNQSVKEISGRNAKRDGHIFEKTVCSFLEKSLNEKFFIDGKSGTKIDIHNADMSKRISVKKTPKNTQVGLITQNNFIKSMNIDDKDIILFINQFFGGEDYSNYPRHRMSKEDIVDDLNIKFLNYLNDNKKKIFELSVSHGSLSQQSDVNTIIFPTKRHDVNSIVMIDVHKMIDEFVTHGEWLQNSTTFQFDYKGSKVFGLQMFGAGKKYTNGYHGLQFRIDCGKIHSQLLSSNQ